MTNVLQTYQALIVGGLGFAGVITTLAVNARLARKQEERKEHREARALRTALIAELRQQKGGLEQAAETTDEAAKQHGNDPEHEGVLPLVRYDAVFNASVDKLGLLSSRQVAAVYEAYLQMRTLTWRLRLLEAQRRPMSAGDQVVLSGRKTLELVSKMH